MTLHECVGDEVAWIVGTAKHLCWAGMDLLDTIGEEMMMDHQGQYDGCLEDENSPVGILWFNSSHNIGSSGADIAMTTEASLCCATSAYQSLFIYIEKGLDLKLICFLLKIW